MASSYKRPSFTPRPEESVGATTGSAVAAAAAAAAAAEARRANGTLLRTPRGDVLSVRGDATRGVHMDIALYSTADSHGVIRAGDDSMPLLAGSLHVDASSRFYHTPLTMPYELWLAESRRFAVQGAGVAEMLAAMAAGDDARVQWLLHGEAGPAAGAEAAAAGGKARLLAGEGPSAEEEEGEEEEDPMDRQLALWERPAGDFGVDAATYIGIMTGRLRPEAFGLG